ncbi:MAG: response regulator [Turneriella sp.]|nr:response regulator [Turneriella sp.]
MPAADSIYRILSDGIGYPVCVFDASGRVVMSNDSFERLVGARDLQGITLTGAFEKTEFRTLVPGIREGLQGKSPNPHVVAIEGFPPCHFEAVVRPVFEGESVAFVVITLADISQKLESLHFADKAREFYSHVFDAMPVIYLMVDEELAVLRANRSAHAAFGYAPTELLGLNISRLVALESGDAGWQHIVHRDASSAGAKIACDAGMASGIRQNGSRFPLRLSVVPCDLEGVVTYSLVLIDQSEDHQREERRLDEAKKQQGMMRNEALGKLAGKFAHDMNNILAVIGGYAEILGLAPRDEDIEAVFEINHAVRRAANLTARILAYTGRQQLSRRLADVKALISERTLLWKDVLGEAVQLDLQLRAPMAVAFFDENMMVQIILSLLANCREAVAETGTVTIYVDAVDLTPAFFKERGMDAPGGAFAEIGISDNGPGIPAENLASIFEPYYSTKDPNKSSGLGLAIVLGIMKQHDGYIFCDSTPGKGTTMRLFLPLSKEEVFTTEQEFASSINPADFTILVVDDEDKILRILETSLREAGFRIFTAVNGRAAIDWIKHYEGKVDLLISDVMMPEVTGIQLAQYLLELFPQLPIIFVTGYSSQIIDEHPVLRNFPIIHKPFSPRAVAAAAIQEIARNSRAEDGLDYAGPE